MLNVVCFGRVFGGTVEFGGLLGLILVVCVIVHVSCLFGFGFGFGVWFLVGGLCLFCVFDYCVCRWCGFYLWCCVIVLLYLFISLIFWYFGFWVFAS